MDELGRTTDRWAGAVLLFAPIVTVAAMSHHPSGARVGAAAPLVHSALIAVLLLMAWAFFQFVVRSGGSRPLMMGGLVAYAAGLFGHVGAAMLSGFVVPSLVASSSGAVHADVLLFSWESNQALAKFGVYLTSLAYVLWSADLVMRATGAWRLTGMAGLAMGSAPALLLSLGVIHMDVGGASLVYAILASWGALVGIQLWRVGMSPSLAADASL